MMHTETLMKRVLACIVRFLAGKTIKQIINNYY